jgi:hypothetical protein
MTSAWFVKAGPGPATVFTTCPVGSRLFSSVDDWIVEPACAELARSAWATTAVTVRMTRESVRSTATG